MREYLPDGFKNGSRRTVYRISVQNALTEISVDNITTSIKFMGGGSDEVRYVYDINHL